jgi:acyl-[acyl-carrier-protein]-phospholipid O-acyltransferase / long-chain-fatty-acid--[acyl-carrier-protein] ligase
MVSLGAVEDQAAKLWPDGHHAVVALPDPRRGEQIVLVTDRQDADRAALLGQMRASGLSELFVPKAVVTVPRVPLLGTGKVDYRAVAALAAGQKETVGG